MPTPLAKVPTARTRSRSPGSWPNRRRAASSARTAAGRCRKTPPRCRGSARRAGWPSTGTARPGTAHKGDVGEAAQPSVEREARSPEPQPTATVPNTGTMMSRIAFNDWLASPCRGGGPRTAGGKPQPRSMEFRRRTRLRPPLRPCTGHLPDEGEATDVGRPLTPPWRDCCSASGGAAGCRTSGRSWSGA